jgi:hypothetical protein
MCDARSRREDFARSSSGAVRVTLTPPRLPTSFASKRPPWDLVRDVVSSAAIPHSSTGSRSSSGPPAGPSHSQRASKLACAGSSAELAFIEKSHPHVPRVPETRDEALVAERRHNAREDEQT